MFVFNFKIKAKKNSNFGGGAVRNSGNNMYSRYGYNKFTVARYSRE